MGFAFVLQSAAAIMASAVTFAAPSVPLWAEAPSVADVAAAYPARARAAHVGGQVTLTCQIEHRRPTQCAAVGEQPEGYGFDFAARQLARQMRTADGSFNGQEVLVPVTFDPAVLTGAASVARPVFTALPAASDFQAHFPQAANGVNQVRVVLACVVGPGGVPRDCSVEREEPAGQGYGDGALPVAGKFKLSPWTAEGEPTVGAHVRLPIRYELTPAPAAAATPQPAKP
jgi:hypothetical protein